MADCGGPRRTCFGGGEDKLSALAAALTERLEAEYSPDERPPLTKSALDLGRSSGDEAVCLPRGFTSRRLWLSQCGRVGAGREGRGSTGRLDGDGESRKEWGRRSTSRFGLVLSPRALHAALAALLAPGPSDGVDEAPGVGRVSLSRLPVRKVVRSVCLSGLGDLSVSFPGGT